VNLAHVLSESQVVQISEAAEGLLETTGFKVLDEEALGDCAKAGAKVDPSNGLVRLPRALLRELLAQVPRKYLISGIDGRTYEVGGGEQWGVAIVTDPWIVDYATQTPRRPRLEDLRRHTLIAQSMDHVAAISCMDYPVTDVEGPSSSLRAWEEHLLHHTKHTLFAPADEGRVRQWQEILEIIVPEGERGRGPLFSVMVAVISPLSISKFNVDLMRMAVRHGAPIVPTICPMAGSTAPYSLVGALLQGHVENLFMAALTQILCPGHPFQYAFGPSVMGMRSGHDRYYTLDKVLWKSAAVQLARACGPPVTAECGGTMTYRYDPQAGMEGSLFMLAAVASGADLLAGFGSCFTGMGMSAEFMLVQEAWMKAARFLLRGIGTEGLGDAIESIRKAGPGGEFLTDDLTLRNLHGDEFFSDCLFDTSARPEESRSMLERAHDRVEEILAKAQSPVPHPIQERIGRYFRDARGKTCF